MSKAEKMRRRLQSMRTQCPAYLLRAWGSLGLGIEPLELDSDSDIEEVARGVLATGPLGQPAR